MISRLPYNRGAMDKSISVEKSHFHEADRKGKLPKPENMTNSSSWYITEHAMYSH